MPRVVVDTNVLVSGTLAPAGFPARIVEAFEAGEVELVASESILEEYVEVMRRPHISRKYPVAANRPEALLYEIRARAVMVGEITLRRYVPGDPKDDMIVACALDGRAEFVVSGDPHLRELGTFHGVRFMTPKQFVDEVLRW